MPIKNLKSGTTGLFTPTPAQRQEQPERQPEYGRGCERGGNEERSDDGDAAPMRSTD